MKGSTSFRSFMVICALCVFMGFFLRPPIMDRVELINGIAMPGEITRLGHPERIVPRTTLLQRFQ